MSLTADQLRHEAMLQRVATGLLKTNVYPSLADAYKSVREILLAQEEIKSAAQLNRITKAISKSVTEIYSAGWQEVTKELQSLAVYESSYYAELIGKWNDVDLSTPGSKSIIDYVNAALMVLGEGERAKVGAWAEFVNTSVAEYIEQYNNLVKIGYTRGATVQQIARSLKTFNDGLAKQQAEALARTGVMHYAQSAREAMAVDNRDIIDKRYYLSLLDNRTTLGCRSLHGKTWDIEDDNYVRLPRHFRCLTGDTLVSTCSDVSSVYKRAYKGAMVDIRTKSGRRIKITPNHPVLASFGWVAAEKLNVGDKLFCVENVSAAFKDYKNNAVTKFSELFSSCEVSVDSSFVTNRPTTAEDFHSDVTDSNVDVIDIDGFTWNRVAESIRDSVKNKLLVFGSSIKLSLFAGGNSALEVMRKRFTSNAFIGSYDKSSPFFGSGVIHPCLLLLRSISSAYASGFKSFNSSFYRASKTNSFSNAIYANTGTEGGEDGINLSISEFGVPSIDASNSASLQGFMDGGRTKASDIANFLDGIIGNGSELDEIVDIRLFEFDGHVYNLENKDNWYTSNGIVTHNCRSSYVFLLEGQDKPIGMAPAIGSGADYPTDDDKKPTYKGRKDLGKFKIEQVPADISPDAWLRQQSREFVIDSLGKTRAELFLDGGLKIESMTDTFGNPLTLEQLRERDSKAFAKIGI